MDSLPRIIARGGVTHAAPENTIAAFVKCIDEGLSWFHTDIRQLADGSLVAMRDPTVDRTTNGSGLLAELTFSDVRRLDAGAWFDPRYRFERIPELASVIDLVGGSPLSAVVEVHDVDIEAVVRAVETLQDPQRLVIVSSSIRDLDSLARRTPTALGMRVGRERLEADLPGVISHAQECGATIYADARGLHEEYVEALVSAGLDVAADLVNDPGQASELCRWGVSGVIVDHCEAFRP